MNAWWWVPIGLAAWSVVSLAVGVWLGPVLRRSARTRDVLDAQMGQSPAEPEKPQQGGPRAA
jgi:hypothetical protein